MKYLRLPKKLGDRHGFTIVELMIATAVFSMVILLLVLGVIQITDNYYKGIVESNTQNTARDVMNTIAQAIQFSSSSSQAPNINIKPAGSPSWICVGNQQFTFILGNELVESSPGTHQSVNALVLSTITTCPTSVGSFPSGRELLNTHMRLANLSVMPSPTAGFYSVDVRVVYGDDALLVNPTSPTASCSGQAGDQFCAASELQSVVEQRQT